MCGEDGTARHRLSYFDSSAFILSTTQASSLTESSDMGKRKSSSKKPGGAKKPAPLGKFPSSPPGKIAHSSWD